MRYSITKDTTKSSHDIFGRWISRFVVHFFISAGISKFSDPLVRIRPQKSFDRNSSLLMESTSVVESNESVV